MLPKKKKKEKKVLLPTGVSKSIAHTVNEMCASSLEKCNLKMFNRTLNATL
jgi:hypothetical protein